MSAPTDLKTPVGLGTAPLGSRPDGPLRWGPQDEDVSVRTVVAAIDAGVGWIDTAPFYGWGLAEEIVGRALAVATAPVTVLTKCGTQRGDDGRPYEDASPAAIRRGVEASLQRLGLERLDVVQIHDPDPSTPIEDSWTELMRLVDEGLIGGAGLSNHPAELMDRALAVGPMTVVQHQYSLLHRRPEQDGTLDWCARHGVPFLAWAPLASGFLTEGFDVAALAADDLRRGLPWAGVEHERTTRILRTLTSVAQHHDTSVSAVALAWTTRRPGTHAIVGARTPAEAAAMLALPALSEDDITELTQA